MGKCIGDLRSCIERNTIRNTTTKLTRSPRYGSRDARYAPRPIITRKAMMLPRLASGLTDRSLDNMIIAAVATVTPTTA